MGFIAVTWAAAIGAVNMGLSNNEELFKSATNVVGTVAKDMKQHHIT